MMRRAGQQLSGHVYPSTHRGHVYRRSGFIHDEDAALPHKSSGQTEELPLTDTEVLPTLGHHRIWTQTDGFSVNSSCP